MVITLRLDMVIKNFFKTILFFIILLFASSLVLFPIANNKENNKIGIRTVTILEKIEFSNSYRFKVLDNETGNKFSINPTKEWFNESKEGDVVNVKATYNDTRAAFIVWEIFSFIIDCVILFLITIGLLLEIPEFLKKIEGKEVKIDLRSKKKKIEEKMELEYKKSPEFKVWKEDFLKALKSID